MQIIIDVLAGIGFLTVLGFVWVAFELLKESRREKNAIIHTKLCRETKQECNPYKCHGKCKGFYLLSETGKNRRKRRWAKRLLEMERAIRTLHSEKPGEMYAGRRNSENWNAWRR